MIHLYIVHPNHAEGLENGAEVVVECGEKATLYTDVQKLPAGHEKCGQCRMAYVLEQKLNHVAYFCCDNAAHPTA